MTQAYKLIIFDLDGVITTEHIYWDCARLTLWELLQLRLQVWLPYGPAVHDVCAREYVLPQSTVFNIKNRAINSNWDLTFLGACALLLALPADVGQGAADIDDLWRSLTHANLPAIVWPAAVDDLLMRMGDRRGADLLRAAGEAAAEHLGLDRALLVPDGPLWQALYARFQGWYDGRLMGVWGAPPLPERPVCPAADMQRALSDLREAGCTLGIATGRPYVEAEYPLRSFGCWVYFDVDRIGTYSAVEKAQAATGMTGLGKPHPYTVQRVLYPTVTDDALLHDPPGGLPGALLVGDSASDALAARAAGIHCLGVLSGVQGEVARQERRAALLNAGCIDVVEAITAVPGWLSGPMD
jgi:phosphoglycolate phosphatase-like HAD superfamily hydrolase